MEMKNVSFILWKKLNGLSGLPIGERDRPGIPMGFAWVPELQPPGPCSCPSAESEQGPLLSEGGDCGPI